MAQRGQAARLRKATHSIVWPPPGVACRWPDAPWMISLASSGLGAGSVQTHMASRSERHDWRAPDGGQ